MMTTRTESNNTLVIKNAHQLAFAIFCIENMAMRLNINPKELFTMLTTNTDILHNYIVAGYEFLHTQDRDYIIDDILQEMRRRGMQV